MLTLKDDYPSWIMKRSSDDLHASYIISHISHVYIIPYFIPSIPASHLTLTSHPIPSLIIPVTFYTPHATVL